MLKLPSWQGLSLPKTWQLMGEANALDEEIEFFHAAPEGDPTGRTVFATIEMPAESPDGQGDLGEGVERLVGCCA